MKFSNSDFQLMRWNIMAISASAILSSMILYGSQQYADHTLTDFHVAQKQINDAHSHLNSARQDQENLAKYSSDYIALEDRKLIGDNYRLDWMEGLDKLRQQNLVVDFRYNIAPQNNYVAQPAIDSGSFDIHYSEMKLQLDILHEGQLLNFFNALRSQIKGQYLLKGCTMQRIAIHDSDHDNVNLSAAPHIKAECNGGWITLKNRNTQP